MQNPVLIRQLNNLKKKKKNVLLTVGYFSLLGQDSGDGCI